MFLGILQLFRHSLRGLCGLKYGHVMDIFQAILGHSLRGLCGLKSKEAREKRLRELVTACEGCVD